MAGRILDGKAVAKAIQADLKQDVEELISSGGRRPQLVAVLVGDNAASSAYVRSKAKTCEKVGMIGRTLRLPADITQEDLEKAVEDLNQDSEVDGILVQLPLPKHVDERRILEMIRPEKDVDGFHPVNVGRLWTGEDCLAPATPSGVIELLRREGIAMKGRHAVIVGRSNIVGKPMAALLLREHATVTICHSRTQDLADECRRADILVAAVGWTALIGAEHVREGAVVIDVGMNRVDEESELERLYPGDAVRRARFAKRGYLLTGDVDFHAATDRASALTPVPGGVRTADRRHGGGQHSEGLPPAPGLLMKRFLLGLTGGLASGKSTVARLLDEAGFHVVDADRVVAELYAPGGAGAVAMAELLGPEVLDDSGAVDKPAVARLIFGDSEARKRVEQAVHPLVHAHFRKVAESLEGVVVYEATLLVESGHSQSFDLVISVEAPEEQRLAWAVGRGMSEEEARARLAAQGNGAGRRAGVHRILENDGTLADLEEKVAALADELRERVA